MKKRLIDANALAKRIAHLEIYEVIKHVDFKTSSIFEEVRNAMFELVLKRPTIDAVEVVRCRECKHAIVNQNHIDKPLICCLTKMVGTTDEDWFCADGKRRMDGGAER